MSTFTATATKTFTITHARYIASKVATDLKRFQRFYNGQPSDAWIDNYEGELIELLQYEAIDYVVYGFKRDGNWTEASVRYKAVLGGLLAADDDPGKIRPGLDVAGASFTSFLSYSSSWWLRGEGERASIKSDLPFQRSSGEAPALEAGYWADDLNYSAGGRGLGRSVVRS